MAWEALVQQVKDKIQYNININRDFKRIWDSEFGNGKELFEREIDSNPLILDREVIVSKS